MHLEGLRPTVALAGHIVVATVAGQGWLAGPSGPLRMQGHNTVSAGGVNAGHDMRASLADQEIATACGNSSNVRPR